MRKGGARNIEAIETSDRFPSLFHHEFLSLPHLQMIQMAILREINWGPNMAQFLRCFKDFQSLRDIDDIVLDF